MLERKVVRFSIRRRFNRLIRQFKPLDRRRAPRFIPKRYIECVCSYTKSGRQEEFPAEIIDISKVGILMMTGENKIYPQTEVEMRFQLSSRQDAIVIHGEIVRTYRHKIESWYYSGVEFQEKGEEKGINSLLDFALRES